MTALFRIALLFIAVVLAAPLRFATCVSSDTVSDDDRALAASGILDDDDSMSERAPGEEFSEFTWRAANVEPGAFGAAPLAVLLTYSESGLGAASGVPDDLFRPPRA
ncbi:MAG TPA: hypothetical protein VHE30_07580 [Polyangiaceae bacterium]|nr:hypothetical protein [Polyangiaceae bacterium]